MEPPPASDKGKHARQTDGENRRQKIRRQRREDSG